MPSRCLLLPCRGSASMLAGADPSAAAAAAAATTRYRARVLYDGTDFVGSQLQQNGRSVAGTIEDALSLRLQQPIKLGMASRTDSGVHSRGQACHFDVASAASGSGRPPPTPAALQRACNSLLPFDVRLAEMELATEVGDEGMPWHSRFWSSGKLYSYRWVAGPSTVPDPNERRTRAHVRRALRRPAMEAAAAHLVGELDVAALANTRPGDRRPVTFPEDETRRTIRSVTLVDEGGGRMRCDVHLQAAMYKQVRNMVGLLWAVGHGKLDASDVPGLLASRDRNQLPMPAPAHGLTLESVYYEEGWGGAYAHPLHADGARRGAQRIRKPRGLALD